MKRKIIALTAVLCLLVTMGLTGCGSGNPYEDMDLSEYIKVADYKGMERQEIKVSVSDEEVDAQVRVNVENSAEEKTVTEGKVKEGDTVNIDYEGKLDGVAFEGGTAQGYDLVIGSGTFIDGFEEQLIGAEIGSTVDLDLTFPENYSSAELAGQDVVFTVKINSATKVVIPEYNDEWVKNNSDVDTTEDYEAIVRDDILEDKKEEKKHNLMAGLWNKVVENSEVIKYPEDLVQEYIDEMETEWENMAESYGVELEDLWAMYGIDSKEAYDKQNRDAAEAFVKEQMVMYYIAQTEGLEYTDEEYEELEVAIEEAGYTDDNSFKKDYGQGIDEYINSALTFNAVSEFIYDNSVVK